MTDTFAHQWLSLCKVSELPLCDSSDLQNAILNPRKIESSCLTTKNLGHLLPKMHEEMLLASNDKTSPNNLAKIRIPM
jgi:hypothetical protein